MGVEYLNVEKSVTAFRPIGLAGVSVLPEVLPESFEQIAASLTEAQRAHMLTERLVPLTGPKGQKLYADAAPWRQRHIHFPQIVAQVAAPVFAKTVWQQFSHGVAKIATEALRRKTPQLSAHQRLTREQSIALVLVLEMAAVFFTFLPLELSGRAFCEVFSLVFASMSWIRVLALAGPSHTARHAPEMDDLELPSYSVLVPLYKEAKVLPQLIRALSDISYPPDKLDIKIILEEKDVETRKAAHQIMLPPHFELLVVPKGHLQTKPRALNYALQFARGELVTIYDAEDVPHPMQLRRAARVFAHSPERLACLQARLMFYNADESWLSRQFAVEYAVQFELILPTLARRGLPLPLGGTSNHFRTSVLRHIHGWDPYNVTEDADIGLRLARAGFSCGMLHSTTLEEANIEWRNWLSQRARWLKGFLQTWLVHMRHPRKLRRQVGWLGFLAVQSTLFGVLLSALLHPLFLGVMVWQMAHGSFIDLRFELPRIILGNFHIVLLAASYAIMMWCGVRASRKQKLRGRAWIIASMPLYWLLTSIAGWIALWQFLVQPFHWNKTRHGLSRMNRRRWSSSAARPTSSPA